MDNDAICLPPPAEFGPAQCRAARGLLHWTQNFLARTAKVTTGAVWRFESGRSIYTRQWTRMRVAFEEAGIIFTPQGITSRFPDTKDRPPPRIKSYRERVPPQNRLDIDKMNATVAAYRSGKSMEEVGLEMNISRERVRQRLVQYEQLTGQTIPRHSPHHRHVEAAAEGVCADAAAE